jgi:ABC-type branched-subunit amino acid transport system substrate-binding protein
MVVCSILPNDPNLVAWMFSLLPNPTYEVDTRLQYLKDKTQIREIGILYDQSPYANLQAKLAQGNADKFGLKVVGAEQFQQSDADFGVTIKKLQAAGARAILKMGTGPSSITAAKSLKELALGIPLLTSTDDLSVLVQVAKVLGKDMFFVAGQTQIYGSLADSDPAKKAIAEFVAPWREQYGERDPFWAGRGYDAMMILAAAVRSAKSVDGEKVRDALNVVSAFQGTSGLYNFNADHRGVTRNPFVLAQIVDGKVVIVE